MLHEEESLLTKAEEILKERFKKEDADRQRLPSDAAAAQPSGRIVHLTLPDDMRAKMPYTKDKFLVRENPHLVQWEREVRKFLRNLSPEHGHRVSAVMIYEWATGIRVVDVMEMEQNRTKLSKPHTTWRGDLRKINKVLQFYFGKPYMTYIMGRKVPKAYRVKPGYYIRRHRPMTLTLYAEYCEGVLYP
jgi:hypothetical protein